MKFSLAFAICLLSSAVNACRIQKINSKPVQQIEFDDKSNTYVISVSDSKPMMSLLNSENKVSLKTPSEVPGKSYITTHGVGSDIYVFFEFDPEPLTASFYRYNDQNSASNSYNKSTCGDTKNFIDGDNYAFINTANGVSLISPKSAFLIIVPVKNLENFTFCHHTVDGEGNVYLASNEVNSLFVITKEGKYSPEPFAKKVTDSSNKPISKLVKAYDNYALAVYNTENSMAELRELTIDETKPTFTRIQSQHFGHILGTGKAFSFTTVDQNNITVVHTAKKDNVFSISLSDVHFDRKREINVLDSENNAFFAYDGGLLFIKPDPGLPYNPMKMEMPNNETIDALAVDKNDRIWILAKNLYVYSREMNCVTLASNLTFAGIGDAFPILKVKETTQEIFIGANDGLYVCTNE